MSHPPNRVEVIASPEGWLLASVYTRGEEMVVELVPKSVPRLAVSFGEYHVAEGFAEEGACTREMLGPGSIVLRYVVPLLEGPEETVVSLGRLPVQRAEKDRDMSKLEARQATHRWIKLESVEATFPAKDHADSLKGETKLTITIESGVCAYGEAGSVPTPADFVDRDQPRMRINPSHGFVGYSRAESDWIARTVPELWDEWERRVGADGPKGTG